MSAYEELKSEACTANLKLPELGLVLFTFGNVSVADHTRGVFAIKPSGVPYKDLNPSMMVVMSFDGQLIEGSLRPSSDMRTHALLYKHWHEVGSIVHTHSTYATAWAQAQADIPIFGTTHADHTTTDIPCAPPMDDEMILGDYEHETGHQILNCLRKRDLNPKDLEMILVGNHAPFTWGKTSEKAVYNAAVLEELARMAYLTLQINPSAPTLKDALIRKHYERKHGPHAYYGNS